MMKIKKTLIALLTTFALSCTLVGVAGCNLGGGSASSDGGVVSSDGGSSSVAPGDSSSIGTPDDSSVNVPVPGGINYTITADIGDMEEPIWVGENTQVGNVVCGDKTYTNQDYAFGFGYILMPDSWYEDLGVGTHTFTVELNGQAKQFTLTLTDTATLVYQMPQLDEYHLNDGLAVALPTPLFPRPSQAKDVEYTIKKGTTEFEVEEVNGFVVANEATEEGEYTYTVKISRNGSLVEEKTYTVKVLMPDKYASESAMYAANGFNLLSKESLWVGTGLNGKDLFTKGKYCMELYPTTDTYEDVTRNALLFNPVYGASDQVRIDRGLIDGALEAGMGILRVSYRKIDTNMATEVRVGLLDYVAEAHFAAVSATKGFATIDKSDHSIHTSYINLYMISEIANGANSNLTICIEHMQQKMKFLDFSFLPSDYFDVDPVEALAAGENFAQEAFDPKLIRNDAYGEYATQDRPATAPSFSQTTNGFKLSQMTNWYSQWNLVTIDASIIAEAQKQGLTHLKMEYYYTSMLDWKNNDDDPSNDLYTGAYFALVNKETGKYTQFGPMVTTKFNNVQETISVDISEVDLTTNEFAIQNYINTCQFTMIVTSLRFFDITENPIITPTPVKSYLASGVAELDMLSPANWELNTNARSWDATTMVAFRNKAELGADNFECFYYESSGVVNGYIYKKNASVTDLYLTISEQLVSEMQQYGYKLVFTFGCNANAGGVSATVGTRDADGNFTAIGDAYAGETSTGSFEVSVDGINAETQELVIKLSTTNEFTEEHRIDMYLQEFKFVKVA